ncbi:MAG: class I adenylate cyclase [Gammaproteobacteria bacterium]|nr:class I adenylate cyclase [Gammaproteobacteria bacterium]
MGQKTPENEPDTLEIDRKQLKQLQRRFLELNEKRHSLLQQHLGQKERELIQLLPLFFHINHPTLPGYVNGETPCGVSGYQPEKTTVQLAKKYSRSLDYKPRAATRIDIFGIYLMGSAGSIAHSMQSDLDVWVCVRDDLSKEQFELLQQKRSRIKAWCETHALDCNIYLVTEKSVTDSIAEGHKPTMSEGLLLDEFYRTQIYLAGRFLLWWLIPPEYEESYQEYADRLFIQRYVKQEEWIDFGPIPTIELEEYIDNALWYIDKALESPYKTALKLVLMESYLSQYPKVKLISQSYKIFVHNLIDNATVIDAYLLMHRKVEEYLILNDQLDRLEFVRRCLYQKINYRRQKLKGEDRKQSNIVEHLIEEWQWSKEKRQLFDNRSSWDINQIGNEKRLYIRQLITSFRTIGQFLKQQATFFDKYKTKLLTLSRKISANLELTQGKIERVNINFVPQMNDKHLSIVRQNKGKDLELWSFYDRAISQQEATSAEPVYQCSSLLELLVWAKINGLLNENTSLQYKDSKQQLQYDELERLIQILLSTYSEPSRVRDDEYLEKPIVQEIHCFVNVAQDRLTNIAKQGMHIITKKMDPLCYGNECLNLIETIDLFYQNSWGEKFVIHFAGQNSISEAAIALLELIDRQEQQPKIQYYSFSSIRAADNALRVKHLFSQLKECFKYQDQAPGKFVYRLGTQYHLVEKQEKRFIVHSVKDEVQLGQLIINQFSNYQRVVFDNRCFTDPVIVTAIKKSEPGVNTLIVNRQSTQQTSYCFVDQYGGVVFGSLDVEFWLEDIETLRRFLKNSLPDYDEKSLKVYQIEKGEKLTRWEHSPAPLENFIAIDCKISSETDSATLTVSAKDMTYEMLLADPKLPRLYQAWLDRAFSTTPDSVFIDRLDLPVPDSVLSEGRLLVERKKLYHQLGF